MAGKKKKNPAKTNKPKKEKGVMDLKNPENAYVLSKVAKLSPKEFMDDNYLKAFCQNARKEYRKGLNK